MICSDFGEGHWRNSVFTGRRSRSYCQVSRAGIKPTDNHEEAKSNFCLSWQFGTSQDQSDHEIDRATWHSSSLQRCQEARSKPYWALFRVSEKALKKKVQPLSLQLNQCNAQEGSTIQLFAPGMLLFSPIWGVRQGSPWKIKIFDFLSKNLQLCSKKNQISETTKIQRGSEKPFFSKFGTNLENRKKSHVTSKRITRQFKSNC